MKNRTLEVLKSNNLDLKQVKAYFYEHWSAIRLLQIGNYMLLSDFGILSTDNEEVLSMYLLGASRIFEINIGPCPNTVEEAWQAVQFLLEEILPDGTDFIEPEVRITYSRAFD